MKKYFLLPAALFIMGLAACSTDAGNMANMDKMKDSVFQMIPTTAAVTLNVQNDRLLLITLGDASLYKASAEERRKTATELGAMTRRIFGKESRLQKAKLIVTADEKNQQAEPADGIVTEIDLPQQ
jgi:uncharacterized lipoprotein